MTTFSGRGGSFAFECGSSSFLMDSLSVFKLASVSRAFFAFLTFASPLAASVAVGSAAGANRPRTATIRPATAMTWYPLAHLLRIPDIPSLPFPKRSKANRNAPT